MSLLVLLLSCGAAETAPPSVATPAPTTVSAPAQAPSSRGPWTAPPPSVVPAAERVVAIGDVHGDLGATRSALRLAGVLDEDDHWTGGTTVVVQTGDQLDRGDDEQAILDLFERLAEEAWAAGGAFYSLLGNHEVMNVALDLRYVTPGGFADFSDTPLVAGDPRWTDLKPAVRGRVAAFSPGGPYARILARHNVVMQVGETVFAHGGVLPEHAQAGLDTLNRTVQDWMLGGPVPPDAWMGPRAPTWTRLYSDGTPSAAACAQLDETLQLLGATRMVVGHTVQREPSSACGDKVWRIDVGMAAHYGGQPAALEITPKGVKVLR